MLWMRWRSAWFNSSWFNPNQIN